MAVRTGRDGLTHLKTVAKFIVNEHCVLSVEMWRDKKAYNYYAVQIDESIDGFQIEQDLIFTKTLEKANYVYMTLIRLYEYGRQSGAK